MGAFVDTIKDHKYETSLVLLAASVGSFTYYQQRQT